MYCENIDKPEMNCNGKCHLMQELDNEQSDAHAFYLNKNLHENIWLYVARLPNVLNYNHALNIDAQPNEEPNSLYQFIFSDFILHPPIV